MGNCLKNQLKEVVHNDNLVPYDSLRLNLVSASFPITVQPIDGESLNLHAISGTVNKDGSDVQDCVLTPSSPIFNSNTNAVVDIRNKFNIYYIRDIVSVNNLQLSSIKYLENLYEIYRCTLIGNLLDLENNSNIVKLTVYNTPITNYPDYSEENYKRVMRSLHLTEFGRIWCTKQNLSFVGSYLPNSIESLYLGEDSFEGEIESLVAGIKNNGRTSGEVQLTSTTNSNIKFIDVILSDFTNETLSWEPSGNNTKITFKGQETIISIASDNTWTRVG